MCACVDLNGTFLEIIIKSNQMTCAVTKLPLALWLHVKGKIWSAYLWPNYTHTHTQRLKSSLKSIPVTKEYVKYFLSFHHHHEQIRFVTPIIILPLIWLIDIHALYYNMLFSDFSGQVTTWNTAIIIKGNSFVCEMSIKVGICLSTFILSFFSCDQINV